MPRCPECGSDYVSMNTMFDSDNYEMYTCQDCYHRFNSENDTDN